MGLDMYLTGEKYMMEDYRTPANNKLVDGYRLESQRLALGYWRKHPDLHGFIVKTFADGKDECQNIDLGNDDLKTILEAVKTDTLPFTKGFFFGSSGSPTSENEEDRQSYFELKKETIDILKKAIKWVNTPEDNVIRSVSYRASW